MPTQPYKVNYQVQYNNTVSGIDAIMPYLLQLHPAVQCLLIIVSVIVLYVIAKAVFNIMLFVFIAIMGFLGLWE